MNKSGLTGKVAEKAGITKKKAEDVVNMVFDSMFKAMVNGERIEIRGLGSFVVKEYGAYTGRNPRTGESINVKPKRLPFFKVGKELKEKVDSLGHPATPKYGGETAGGEEPGGTGGFGGENPPTY